jgi:hypothetical protein
LQQPAPTLWGRTFLHYSCNRKRTILYFSRCASRCKWALQSIAWADEEKEEKRRQLTVGEDSREEPRRCGKWNRRNAIAVMLLLSVCLCLCLLSLSARLVGKLWQRHPSAEKDSPMQTRRTTILLAKDAASAPSNPSSLRLCSGVRYACMVRVAEGSGCAESWIAEQQRELGLRHSSSGSGWRAPFTLFSLFRHWQLWFPLSLLRKKSDLTLQARRCRPHSKSDCARPVSSSSSFFRHREGILLPFLQFWCWRWGARSGSKSGSFCCIGSLENDAQSADDQKW